MALRSGLAARCRRHRPDPGRQNRTSEKPPSAPSSCLAGLDRCQTGGMELLPQTARPQDNESRMGTIRDHGSSIHNRRSHSGQDKCQNPVAQREGELLRFFVANPLEASYTWHTISRYGTALAPCGRSGTASSWRARDASAGGLTPVVSRLCVESRETGMICSRL